jgi:hypothetical protein
MNSQQSNGGRDKLLFKYLSLATQLMVSLALAVFVGLKLDKWLHFSTPLLVWILPLLVLVGMIWQIIKDTSKRNNV